MHQLEGGPLPDGVKYLLVQTHWHWGPDDTLGSEHTIEGRKFPLEVHMVHYNEKYKDMEEASNHVDGIAVNAIMYEVRLENFHSRDGGEGDFRH